MLRRRSKQEVRRGVIDLSFRVLPGSSRADTAASGTAGAGSLMVKGTSWGRPWPLGRAVRFFATLAFSPAAPPLAFCFLRRASLFLAAKASGFTVRRPAKTRFIRQNKQNNCSDNTYKLLYNISKGNNENHE